MKKAASSAPVVAIRSVKSEVMSLDRIHGNVYNNVNR